MLVAPPQDLLEVGHVVQRAPIGARLKRPKDHPVDLSAFQDLLLGVSHILLVSDFAT